MFEHYLLCSMFEIFMGLFPLASNLLQRGQRGPYVPPTFLLESCSGQISDPLVCRQTDQSTSSPVKEAVSSQHVLRNFSINHLQVKATTLTVYLAMTPRQTASLAPSRHACDSCHASSVITLSNSSCTYIQINKAFSNCISCIYISCYVTNGKQRNHGL